MSAGQRREGAHGWRLLADVGQRSGLALRPVAGALGASWRISAQAWFGDRHD